MGDPSQSSDHCVHVTVIYLFAGKQRKADIGEFLRAAEQRGLIKLQLKEFDIERQSDHDLTNQDLWSEIFTLIESGNWIVIVSPPCNTFSRARFQFLRHPGPKPVRNRTWPRGFPWLSGRDRKSVDEANFFVTHCSMVDIFCSSIRRIWGKCKVSVRGRFGNGTRFWTF